MCARICYDLLWNYRSFTICDRTSFSRISEKQRLFQWISPNWSIWQNLLGRPFTSQGSLFFKWNQRWLWGENVLIVRLFEAQLIHLKDIIFHPVHLYSAQSTYIPPSPLIFHPAISSHYMSLALMVWKVCLNICMEGTKPIFDCRALLRLNFPCCGAGLAHMGKIPKKNAIF